VPGRQPDRELGAIFLLASWFGECCSDGAGAGWGYSGILRVSPRNDKKEKYSSCGLDLNQVWLQHCQIACFSGMMYLMQHVQRPSSVQPWLRMGRDEGLDNWR
jgi:hypothetical protein